MISNQVLQSTLEGLKQVSRVDMCVVDTDGTEVASTFTHVEDFRDLVISFMNSPAESQVISGYQFFRVMDEAQLEYILIANGNTDDVYMVAKLAAFQLETLIVAYKERFDKDSFCLSISITARKSFTSSLRHAASCLLWNWRTRGRTAPLNWSRMELTHGRVIL